MLCVALARCLLQLRAGGGGGNLSLLSLMFGTLLPGSSPRYGVTTRAARRCPHGGSVAPLSRAHPSTVLGGEAAQASLCVSVGMGWWMWLVSVSMQTVRWLGRDLARVGGAGQTGAGCRH